MISSAKYLSSVIEKLSSVFRVLLVCLPFVSASFISPIAVAQQAYSPEKDPERLNWGRVSSYEDAAKVDSQLRYIRNSKYENRSGFPPHPITEKDLPGFFLNLPISHNSPIQNILPVSKSDAIMVGTITGAKAYFSNDKTNIYSEFQLQVAKVMKAQSGSTISEGGVIDLERQGGQIQFPSGKTITRGKSDEPLPVLGERYLFFLKYNKEGEDYTIITGYQFDEDDVYWLDGGFHQVDGDTARSKLSETDEDQFLAKVANQIETLKQ